MNEKLFRIPSKSVIGGVCAGLANRFNIDVTLLRVLFILGLIFTNAPFFIFYVILWIALPVNYTWGMTNDYSNNFNQTSFSETMKNNSNMTAGVILIGLGSLFLINEFFDVNLGKLWPLALVGSGLYIIFKDKIKGNGGTPNNF